VRELQSQEKPNTKAKKKRIPRKISESYLRNAALYYLQRFSSSSENLRQVLIRKVRKASLHHDTDEAVALVWIDDVVARFLESGLLDDLAYAESKVRALRDRGNSSRLITSKLVAKGVSQAIIQDALHAISERDGNAETEAAMRFARRRRLGPFGASDKREDKRDKSLAAMARAGFSYDLAQRIVDANTEVELRAQLRDQDN
jgi:regulatory protein